MEASLPLAQTPLLERGQAFEVVRPDTVGFRPKVRLSTRGAHDVNDDPLSSLTHVGLAPFLRDDGFGAVNSDPERVYSTSDHTRDGQLYARLGIGARIYALLGYRHPDVRWRYGAPVSAAGAGVRTRMHSQAPSRWEGPCSWCEERSLVWESATPEAFAWHPTSDSENPDGWQLSSRWPSRRGFQDSRTRAE